MKRIAVNGFGRIGRLITRELLKNKDVEIVAINDLTKSDILAHLFKYDTAQGRYQFDVSSTIHSLIINKTEIKVFNKKDPLELPWKDLNVDLVIECTGKFLDRQSAYKHIEAGAKKVILSAPAKSDDIPTVVYNVNHNILTGNDLIISGASCTTNCLAPLISIIHKNYKIKLGLINTVHAYTADQRLQDAPHKDIRRARAAAANIVPTSTGAAKAIGLIIPELKGKLHGIATRVPVITGSFIDITVELEKTPTIEQINEIIEKNSNETIVSNSDSIVSSDVIGETHGCVFDPNLSMVVDNNNSRLYKLFAWYDNEYSYVCQLIRTINYLLNL